MRDNMEPGWYMPAEVASSDVTPWNPYYRFPDGTWIEAQSAGHVEVEFPGEIVWPLSKIGPAGAWIQQPR